METKILSFDNSNIYTNLANQKAEQGDFIKSLGFLFSALKNCNCKKYQILYQIAKTYSQMELFEISNDYWFKYLDVAPKEEKSKAYLELANNYFYLDKIWVAGSYLKLKFDEDGKINSDQVDQEIFEMFSDGFYQGEKINKSLYYLAYPQNKNSVSKIEKRASIEYNFGNFQGVIKFLKMVPSELMSKIGYLNLLTSYYAIEDYQSLIKACKDYIKYYGEDLTCLCFLCTSYTYTDRLDKAEFYYNKAVEIFKSSKYIKPQNDDYDYLDEVYKLLACSAERKDDLVVGECLSVLLKDRPYDVSLQYYNGIYYLNTKRYHSAIESFSYICKIQPENSLYKYYLNLAKSCINEQTHVDNLFPLEYNLEFPKSVSIKYRDKAKKVLLGDKSGKIEIKNNNTINMLFDGILYGSDECAEVSAQALSYAKSDTAIKRIKQILLMPRVANITKRFFIYALLINGEKHRFGVVINNMYTKIKPYKFSFSEKGFGKVVYSAYSAAYAWAISWNIPKPEKVVAVTRELYSKHCHQIIEDNLNADEITAIILASCDFPVLGNLDLICSSLNIDKNKIKKYLPNNFIYKNLDKEGENND